MTKNTAATKDDINNILKAIDALDQKTSDRIDALDQKTSDRIDALDQKTSDRIDALSVNIKTLDKKIDDRIDDVLGVLDVMVTNIDERFHAIEGEQARMQAQTQNILNQLDSIEKRIEISEDERLVMAHQLSRLHDWVERAAERIDVKFAR